MGKSKALFSTSCTGLDEIWVYWSRERGGANSRARASACDNHRIVWSAEGPR